jgi:hypothetical protein
MAANAEFASDYAMFCRDMVYREAPDFASAMSTLAAIAEHLSGKHR